MVTLLQGSATALRLQLPTVVVDGKAVCPVGKTMCDYDLVAKALPTLRAVEKRLLPLPLASPVVQMDPDGPHGWIPMVHGSECR